MCFSTRARYSSSVGRRGFLERMALSVGLVATWPPVLSEGSSGVGVQGQVYSPDAKVVVFQGDGACQSLLCCQNSSWRAGWPGHRRQYPPKARLEYQER